MFMVVFGGVVLLSVRASEMFAASGSQIPVERVRRRNVAFYWRSVQLEWQLFASSKFSTRGMSRSFGQAYTWDGHCGLAQTASRCVVSGVPRTSSTGYGVVEPAGFGG